MHEVKYGSESIKYILKYSNRKTLGIKVSPDGEVTVSAPIDSNQKDIKEKLKKKAAWILKQKIFFKSFEPKLKTRKYIGGEAHLYLGREYILKIVISKHEEKVKFSGKFLEVHTADKSQVETLLKKWYLKIAKEKINEIAFSLIEKFKKYNIAPEKIIFRSMPTRWGSCTSNKKIILNPELIKAPKPCIQYVIIHELCHLVHRSHSQKFYDLQTKEMSDWLKWKMKLERLLA